MTDRISLIAVTLITAALSGCGQGPGIQAAGVHPRVGTQGAITVSGSRLVPNHFYKVGVNTFWSPLFVGTVQTDLAGNIGRDTLAYDCQYVLGNPVNVGFYDQYGLLITGTMVNQTCGVFTQPAIPPAQS
jgi:hypothetical protein